MEHLTAHIKDFGPWALTLAVSIAAKLFHSMKKSVDSLGETKFKADEAHEEVSSRVPEYARRHATWKAHRKTF
jgi:hypothetical protein